MKCEMLKEIGTNMKDERRQKTEERREKTKDTRKKTEERRRKKEIYDSVEHKS
jgi:hypothetical protein